MHATAQALIDLNALRANFDQVRQLTPRSPILAVVKADAYGHGLVAIARALAPLADGFAVARIDEAQTLRAAKIDKRIVLLAGFHSLPELIQCADQGIDIVLHKLIDVESLLNAAVSSPIRVWLKYNSGMHRLGLNATEFQSAWQRLSASANVAEIILMTHYSNADAGTFQLLQQQSSAFGELCQSLDAPRSQANSAGIIRKLASSCDWVRPGIMLYGANPVANSIPASVAMKLQPVMTLRSTIIAIHQLKPGDSVGYNGHWTAPRDSVIATVAVGYGDGYPRHAKNGTPVYVNGHKASLVGTVSMDLLSIDISDCENISIGDEVILWGQQPTVATVAHHAGTISYELLTSVTSRVPRVYCGDEALTSSPVN